MLIIRLLNKKILLDLLEKTQSKVAKKSRSNKEINDLKDVVLLVINLTKLD